MRAGPVSSAIFSTQRSRCSLVVSGKAGFVEITVAIRVDSWCGLTQPSAVASDRSLWYPRMRDSGQLRRSPLADAVNVQHVAERHHSFELVNVSTVHYRQ